MRYIILSILTISMLASNAQFAISKGIEENERGKRIYRQCSSCHGKSSGNLAGMHEENFIYFAKNYRTIFYPNPSLIEVHSGLYSLTNNQIKVLAEYIQNGIKN